jgi:hypothetical protein
MSKKSGLFYRMISFLGLGGMLMQPIPELKYEEEKKVSRSNHHRFRTFGKEITSFGSKPAHYKDKVLYKDQGDIIWTPTGSYWRTRALAEAHKN